MEEFDELCGMETRSLRQAPKPETTVVLLVQEAVTHVPLRRTLFALEQLKQFELPEPLQLAQELSQLWHEELEVSKNSFLLQVGRQRPFESTGRSDGHVEHWLNAPPEQVAQSG